MTDLAADLFCNITDPLACSMAETLGECVDLGKEVFKCSCYAKFDPLTNCSSMFTRQLGAAPYILHGIDLTTFTVLFVLVSLEIIIDLKTRTAKISWSSPLLLVKVFLFLSCCLSIAGVAIELHEDITLTRFNTAADALLSGLRQIVLTATYVLAVVNWVGLLLQVKTLGGIKKYLRIFSKATWVLLLVLEPIHVVFLILLSLDIGTAVVAPLSYMLSALVLLPVIFISGFFLIKVFIWAYGESQQSTRMKQAVRKTICLGVVNLAYVLIFVRIFASVSGQIATYSAWPQFIWLAYSLVPGILIPVAIYIFSENYLLRPNKPWFSGYVAFLKGEDVSVFRSGTTRAVGTATSQKSTKGGGAHGSTETTGSSSKVTLVDVATLKTEKSFSLSTSGSGSGNGNENVESMTNSDVKNKSSGSGSGSGSGSRSGTSGSGASEQSSASPSSSEYSPSSSTGESQSLSV